MVALKWTFARQESFFQDHVGDFEEAQEAGNLQSVFWPMITGKYFAIWSSPEIESAEFIAAEEERMREREERDTTRASSKKRGSATRGSRPRASTKQQGPREPQVFANDDEWRSTRISVSDTSPDASVASH
jgi:hypothetical protein